MLIRSVDAALAAGETRRSRWMRCRPGCCQCCIGPFEITQLDALRLKRGWQDLSGRDPERSRRLRARAEASWDAMASCFPGDPRVGLLSPGQQEQERFFTQFEHEPCPALDPGSMTCDLYSWRPLTCRLFGPPVRCGDQAFAVCEMCFQGASDEEILSCSIDIDPEGQEVRLLERLESETGIRGMTVVAFALAHVPE